ncbi:MAG: sulfotransferase, partial [Acetobacteraceae bacterium]
MIAAENTAEAEALLRAVIADDPACSEAYPHLGRLLGEAGKAEEATAVLEHGAIANPGMVTLWSGVALNRKFSAADAALIETMRNALQRPTLSPAQRMGLHFALGKVHDDIKDYAQAMRHFDTANQIRSQTWSLDRAGLARRTSRLIAATPPGYLGRRPNCGVEDATAILIVGMPRSGTTLVEQILSSHPAIAAGGELGFWGGQGSSGPGVLRPEQTDEQARGIAADYLALLRGIGGGAARVTDKMPFNFAMLGLIRKVFPRALIVHCRRHPIDTCLSSYCTDFAARLDFVASREDLVFFYREYERLMAHWRQVFASDGFIEVGYEELVADPEKLTRRLVAYKCIPLDEG